MNSKEEPAPHADTQRRWKLVRGLNMVTMILFPALGAGICLVAGAVQGEAYLFALAAVGGAGAFIGWCFVQGMEEPKQWR
jgi:hypothetical protein